MPLPPVTPVAPLPSSSPVAPEAPAATARVSPTAGDFLTSTKAAKGKAPPTALACVSPEDVLRDAKSRIQRPMQRSTLPPGELYRAPVVVTHEGNPAYGSLTSLRIKHLRPEDKEEDTVTGLFSEIGTLGWLETHAPKDIFAEGVYDGSLGRGGAIRTQVKDVFASWKPGQAPDDRQLSAIYQLGAARVYALLHDDVVVHGVATKAESDADDAYADACFKSGAYPSMEVVLDQREERIITRLQAFYDAHPGANAVIVFGGNHDFARHVSADFNPRVGEVQLTPPL